MTLTRRQKAVSNPSLADKRGIARTKQQPTFVESLQFYIKALISSFIVYNEVGYWLCNLAALVLDAGIVWYVLNKVKYTNIDWTAYMEQVRIYKGGERNYYAIRGDTGPLVYPAGHLYVYTLLNYFTSDGTNVSLAQKIFAGIYGLNQLAVYSLFMRSKRIGGGVLIVMLCLSHRIHSIFMLRLFNDSIAMLLFFVSVNFMIRKYFPIACVFYSLAVAIKMNILLFAPALFFILLFTVGPRKTVLNLAICGIVQVLVGLEFLYHDPLAYLGRAFELGRVFQYRWSVNWNFIGETVFLAQNFHLALLFAHALLLLVFILSSWFKRHGGFYKLLTNLIKHGKLVDLDTNDILYALFTANLAGIVFARSIHFQFYTWYYHSLFYLLYSTLAIDLKPAEFRNLVWSLVKWILMALALAGIELVYNVYPPRGWSSLLLFVEHAGIVGWLLYHSNHQQRADLKYK